MLKTGRKFLAISSEAVIGRRSRSVQWTRNSCSKLGLAEGNIVSYKVFVLPFSVWIL